MKVGVLVHGYNVNAPNWQEVVWWRSLELVGRLPQAAKVILTIKPELVVFGTGSSLKDGKVEAEIMRDYLLENISKLAILPDFLDVDLPELKEKIAEISRLETSSKNTYQEIEYSARIFRKSGVETIIAVTSSDHAPRSKMNGNKIFSENKDLNCFLGNFAVWSCPGYYGSEGQWPLVVESSHRLYPVIQKMMGLSKKEQEEIIKKATG